MLMVAVVEKRNGSNCFCSISSLLCRCTYLCFPSSFLLMSGSSPLDLACFLLSIVRPSLCTMVSPLGRPLTISFFFSSSSLFVRFLLTSLPSVFLGAIYRAKERGFLLLCMGSSACGGWSASGRGCQGMAPLVSTGRAAGGRSMGTASEARLSSVLAGHAVKRERHPNQRKKQTFSFFPCCTSRGRRKRNSVVQNDTVLLSLSLKKN